MTMTMTIFLLEIVIVIVKEIVSIFNIINDSNKCKYFLLNHYYEVYEESLWIKLDDYQIICVCLKYLIKNLNKINSKKIFTKYTYTIINFITLWKIIN